MRTQLRKFGLRATSTRLAVLEVMHDEARPMSHEEIMALIGPDRFDRATIYRILADLSEAGILRRMDLGGHIWRYEWIDECQDHKQHNAHFLCNECKEVICLPPVLLQPISGSLPKTLHGAELSLLQVSGICSVCVNA